MPLPAGMAVLGSGDPRPLVPTSDVDTLLDFPGDLPHPHHASNASQSAEPKSGTNQLLATARDTPAKPHVRATDEAAEPRFPTNVKTKTSACSTAAQGNAFFSKRLVWTIVCAILSATTDAMLLPHRVGPTALGNMGDTPALPSSITAPGNGASRRAEHQEGGVCPTGGGMLLMNDATSNTHKIWGGGGVPPKTGGHAQTYTCFDTIVPTDYGSSTVEPMTNPFETDLFVPPTLVVGHDSPTDRFLISPYSTSYDSPFEHGDGGVHSNEIFDQIVSMIFSGSPLTPSPLTQSRLTPPPMAQSPVTPSPLTSSPFDPKSSVVSTLPLSSNLELPSPTDTGPSSTPPSMAACAWLTPDSSTGLSSTPPSMAARAWLHLSSGSPSPPSSRLELPLPFDPKASVASPLPSSSKLELPLPTDAGVSTLPLSQHLGLPLPTDLDSSSTLPIMARAWLRTSDKTCASFDFTFDSSTAKRTETVPTNVATELAAADFAMDKVAPLDTG